MSVSQEQIKLRAKFFENSQRQADLDLERQHGQIVHVECVQFIEPIAKYECVVTFADNFSVPSLRSAEQVAHLRAAIAAWHQNTTTAPEESDVAGKSIQRDSIEAEQRQRKPFNSDKSPPTQRQLSLREYAEQNPNRTRLFNGKLFTRDLLLRTEQGGIPEALK